LTAAITTSGHHEAGARDDDVEFGPERILDGIEDLVETGRHSDIAADSRP